MHWPLRGGGPVYGRMVLAWAVLRVLCRIGTVTGTAALYSKRLKDIKVVLQTCMHHALYIYLGSVESPFCKVRAVVRPRLAQRTRTVHGRARGTCCTVHQIGFSIGLRAASGSLQNFWAFGAKAHARPDDGLQWHCDGVRASCAAHFGSARRTRGRGHSGARKHAPQVRCCLQL